eukprot:Lithocolla_globosa_v1_NODE_134_length_5865_cov_11.845465.p1 type:complete len:452 gc:universal NODE_134_length_5865_cov_11.845465:3439-4794(+)
MWKREHDIPATTIHVGLNIDQKTSMPYIDEPFTVLILDECFAVDKYILTTINNMRRQNKCKVIMLGDPKQLEAPGSEKLIDDRMDSWVFGNLCGWQKFKLNVNLRSDSEVFNLCNCITETETASKAYKWLNDRVSTKIVMRNLCKTHKKRLDVNLKVIQHWLNNMEDRTQTHAVVFKEQSSNNKDVDFPAEIAYGMPIICEEAYEKAGLHKGDRFTVYNWGTAQSGWEKPVEKRDPNAPVVEVIQLIDFNETIHTLSKIIFCTHFRLGFATTVHRAQGSTIREPYMLHEANRYDWRMINVGISRTSDPKFILIPKKIQINEAEIEAARTSYTDILTKEGREYTINKIRTNYFPGVELTDFMANEILEEIQKSKLREEERKNWTWQQKMEAEEESAEELRQVGNESRKYSGTMTLGNPLTDEKHAELRAKYHQMMAESKVDTAEQCFKKMHD